MGIILSIPDRSIPSFIRWRPFLPLVDLHQSKSWAPDPQLRVGRPKVPIAPFKPLSKYQHQFGSAFGKHLRWYLWLHILAGWFFTSMLIAGISGLVQKG